MKNILNLSNLFKFWMLILLTGLVILIGVSVAFSQDMIIESSIAEIENEVQERSLNQLLLNIGITHQMSNPCIELEELTRKYCSIPTLHKLLTHDNLLAEEKTLFWEFLQGNAPCEQVALYIGRVCYQKNFAKIINHFAAE